MDHSYSELSKWRTLEYCPSRFRSLNRIHEWICSCLSLIFGDLVRRKFSQTLFFFLSNMQKRLWASWASPWSTQRRPLCIRFHRWILQMCTSTPLHIISQERFADWFYIIHHNLLLCHQSDDIYGIRRHSLSIKCETSRIHKLCWTLQFSVSDATHLIHCKRLTEILERRIERRVDWPMRQWEMTSLRLTNGMIWGYLDFRF